MVVAQREVDVEHVLRSRHSDVEQAAFLVDLVVVAGGHVGRDHAVSGVDDVHNVPFAALGRVDRAEDEPVFLEERRAGKV